MRVEDPLHGPTDPTLHWTTTNVGEAAPGVQTPLSWTLWAVGDTALREMAYRIGVLSRRERRTRCDSTDRVFRPFYGRAALQVEFFARLGDRLPGTSGMEVAKGLLGRVPAELPQHRTRRRYPVIAWRLPLIFVTVPRRLARTSTEFEQWYERSQRRVSGADLAEATAVLREVREMLATGLTIQALAASGVVQPLYDAVSRLVDKTGCGDVGMLSGGGGAEVVGLVTDLWRASRDEISIDEVVRRHGFHGPLEGEVSSAVWRDDPEPLKKIVNAYRGIPDEESPQHRTARRSAERAASLPALLAVVPAVQRPAVRLLLRLAERRIPLRGIAKRFMLQAFDIGRLSARRIGTHLVEAGLLQREDDVFFLTAHELSGALPADPRKVVTERRRIHEDYQRLELPRDWRGDPAPLERRDGDGDAEPWQVAGVGVSAGVTEGVVRVIENSDFDDFEPGEILVAPTTDPSWSAVMMVATALVVDIGGALSHAAVVARELGIPCVVNTRVGTRVLRTGDRVRVDGTSGVVNLLEKGITTP